MIVIPCLAIMAPTCTLCGIVSPILMAIKMINYIFNLGLPYTENIGVLIGTVKLNPIAEFVCCLIMGVLLYLAGRGCWKLLIHYCKKVSNTKSKLSI